MTFLSLYFVHASNNNNKMNNNYNKTKYNKKSNK